MEFFQPMLQSFPGHLFHAAWLKVNRINRLTGRRVLKARWVENFILNVISCPARTVQISQGFGARQLIKLFAHILLMLFSCFAMNMLIYKERWSRLSTLFSHFHFRCLAGERTLSLRRRVMLDCRLHSCFVFFLFFLGGGIYFLAADRQITWRRASRTKDQAACSKECRLYVGMIFDLRCAELNWKQVAEVQNRLKNRTCWFVTSSQFSVFQIVSNHITTSTIHDATLCRDTRKRIRPFNCTWDI